MMKAVTVALRKMKSQMQIVFHSEALSTYSCCQPLKISAGKQSFFSYMRLSGGAEANQWCRTGKTTAKTKLLYKFAQERKTARLLTVAASVFLSVVESSFVCRAFT